MKTNLRYKTWIEINARAFQNNLRVFRSILKPKTKLWAVIKSNSYGHGFSILADLGEKFGVDGFCVDSVLEGNTLRVQGIKKPILVLGPTLPALFKEAEINHLTLSVSNFETFKNLEKSKRNISYHIKMDSGMHRQGFYLSDISKLIRTIRVSTKQMKENCVGLFTHFASAKDVTYPAYTKEQIKEFVTARNLFKKAKFKNLTLHAAATGGTVLYPEAHFDAVRIGIGLFGYWPSKEAKLQHSLLWKKKFTLHPILSWRALVSEVKQIKKGDYVGYDLTEQMREDGTFAVIPIGYWHGYPRSLSSLGEVLIKGKRARVLGRVSMDLIVVRIPKGVTVKVGDMATLIGGDGRDQIDAEEFAGWAGTSSYEVLTRLNPLIYKEIV